MHCGRNIRELNWTAEAALFQQLKGFLNAPVKMFPVDFSWETQWSWRRGLRCLAMQ
jgi:hypothetical protein